MAGTVAEAERFGHYKALWDPRQKYQSARAVLSPGSESLLLFFCLPPPRCDFYCLRLHDCRPLRRCRQVLHPSDIRSASSHCGRSGIRGIARQSVLCGSKRGSGWGLSLRRGPRVDNMALLPAADFSHSSRSFSFITARSIHSRVCQSEELSSMRTPSSYCGLTLLRMTMSMFFGSTGRSTPSPLYTLVHTLPNTTVQFSFEYHSIRPCNKSTIREEEAKLYVRYCTAVKGTTQKTPPTSIIPHL